MDLSTTYLGMTLPHPLIAGSSPLSDDLDTVKELEDGGASAIVLGSLFEEQIVAEAIADELHHDAEDDSSAEASSYYPNVENVRFGADEYLNHLRRVKEAVRIPVIASLNGASPLGWVTYARLMEQGGADALELNIVHTPLDWRRSGAEIEAETLATVGEVKRALQIPVAVKLSPFLTSFGHFAVELDRTGVEGLVLFNRFYDADIDTEELEIRRSLHLSTSAELAMRLRGVAAVAPFVRASLAISGGVHTGLDVVKSTMVGAHVTQLVSALLKNGPGHLLTVRREVEQWLVEHEWDSLAEMRGNMSVDKIPNPHEYVRGNYMRLLESWQGGGLKPAAG
jgi:dihydroorotate dehydrogenase (fumarate)